MVWIPSLISPAAVGGNAKEQEVAFRQERAQSVARAEQRTAKHLEGERATKIELSNFAANPEKVSSEYKAFADFADLKAAEVKAGDKTTMAAMPMLLIEETRRQRTNEDIDYRATRKEVEAAYKKLHSALYASEDYERSNLSRLVRDSKLKSRENPEDIQFLVDIKENDGQLNSNPQTTSQS